MLLRFVINFFRKYKYFILVLIILGISESFLSVYVDSQIENIIDYIKDKPFNSIIYSVGFFALYKAMHQFVLFAKKVVDSICWPRITQYVITRLYLQITGYSFHWFLLNLSGSVVQKMQDLQSGLRYIVYASFYMMNQIFYLIFSITALFSINKLVAQTQLTLSVIYFGISYFLIRKYFTLSNKENLSRQKTLGIITNSLANIVLLKIIGKIFIQFKKNIQPSVQNWVKNEKKLYQFDAYVNELFNFFFITLICSVQIFVLAYLVQQKIISSGEFAFGFVLTVNLARNCLSFVEFLMYNCMSQISLIKSSEEILIDKYLVEDHKDAYPITAPEGEIIFKNVFFKYPGSENYALKNINLHIKPGQKIGIIGKSGSGKSTLLKLILKYYQSFEGDILIDGHNIKNILTDSLCNNISIIPQETNLLSASVLDNLQIFKENASFEEIKLACKKADIDHYISNTPQQYNTILAENGAAMSGGQKQRIGIARAILKNAPILILDEATSALDPKTEEFIWQSINEIFFSQKITTIIITHKIDNLKNTDLIYEIDHGEIVKTGTYEDFIK